VAKSAFFQGQVVLAPGSQPTCQGINVFKIVFLQYGHGLAGIVAIFANQDQGLLLVFADFAQGIFQAGKRYVNRLGYMTLGKLITVGEINDYGMFPRLQLGQLGRGEGLGTTCGPGRRGDAQRSL